MISKKKKRWENVFELTDLVLLEAGLESELESELETVPAAVDERGRGFRVTHPKTNLLLKHVTTSWA